jgi:hypothetical protein
VDRFVDFVLNRRTPVQHYYCGYPSGSAREIRAALDLADHHARFTDATGGMSDAEFALEWTRFLTDHQDLL